MESAASPTNALRAVRPRFPLRSRLFYDVQPVTSASRARRRNWPAARWWSSPPQVPLLPAELTLLEEYGRDGGRLVVMVDGTAARGSSDELLGPLSVAYGPVSFPT